MLSGIGLVVLSYFILALSNSFAKSLSIRIHPLQTVFMQSGVAVIMLLPYALKDGLKGLRPHYIKLHTIRDISGCLAFALSYSAAMFIPIVDVMLLNSASALWVPLILLVAFRQKVPPKLMTCIVLGFIGVLFILKPVSSLFSAGSLLGVFGGLFMAIAMVSLRLLSQKEPRHRIVFFVCLISMFMGALALPFVWVTPNLYELRFVFFNAVGMVSTQIFLTIAYSMAPASRLTPFSYTVVLAAGLIDWFTWNILPTPLSLIGAFFVIGAALSSIALKTARQLT